jgi:hypothetical protein
MKKQFYGINFGFEDNKFYVDYSCSRPVENIKKEFDKRAAFLYEKNPKQLLGLSTGIDSQTVLHTFVKQGIPIETAFLYLVGSNENELDRLKVLEKKYGFKSIVIEINPYSKKEEWIEKYNQTKIAPYQLIHLDFLEQLPKDYDFIQGINGPEFYFHEKDCYLLESANSYDNTRLRALMLSNRTGEIIAWEKTGEIMLSILSDDIIKSFIYSFEYINNNGLIYNTGKAVTFKNYWDVYIKPLFYAKYWKDEIEYFPKYQGPEGIDWIMNGKWHSLDKNLVAILYKDLVEHLSKGDGAAKRYWQRSDSN